MIFQKMQTRKRANIPKMICGITAAISIVVVGFFSLSAFWFWTCLEIIAGGLVAGGCWGEWYLFKNPPDEGDESQNSKRRRKELQCIIAVAIGVTVEFAALSHAIPEAIRLEKDVSEIGTTNAQLVASNLIFASQVEQFRKQNDDLEATAIRLKNAIPQRQIPEKQRELFIATLLDTNILSPKIDIKVFIQDVEDPEAKNFADSVRKMLNDAGYGTNREAVIKIRPFNVVPNASEKSERMPQIFAIYAINYDGKKIPLSMPSFGGCIATFFPTKNSVQTEIGNPRIPIVNYYSNNPNDILGGICNILSYIGFRPKELALPGVLNPVEVAFYIPPQVQ